MKTLRFKVGDLARLIYSPAMALPPEKRGPFPVTDVVEIIQIGGQKFKKQGTYVDGMACDYLIKTSLRPIAGCMDEWLAPLPGESASHIHADTLKIFNVTPNSGLPVGPRRREKV